MKIRLLCIGRNMPAWVQQGYHEYAKRLSNDIQLELTELTPALRTKNRSKEQLIEHEYDLIQSALRKNEIPVVLDTTGTLLSTEQLAQQIHHWLHSGDNISIIIGGPDGVDVRIKQQAQQIWSLSPLTFPHPLVRVMVAEQIYRAWSILHRHPYHRA